MSIVRMRRQLLEGGAGSGGSRAEPDTMFNFTSGLMDPRITFQGNSANRWGFDSAGVLVNFAASTPKFDYGPMGGGACRGIRIDGSNINRCLHNQDFTNAAWTKTSVTAAKDAVGLDGVANSCSTLTATGNGGKVTQSFTLASALRVIGFYIKRKTGTGTISITLDDGSTSTAVTGLINSSTFTLVSANQTITNPVIGIIFGTSGDEVIVDVATLIDGPLLGTPILTAGSSVTRGRDDLTITSTNFTSWYNADRGTFIADFIIDEGPSAVSGVNRSAVFIDDASGNTNESMNLRAGQGASAGRMAVFIADGGVTQYSAAPVGATVTAGVTQRIGLSYELNNTRLAFNGTVDVLDTSITLPTVTRAVLGSRTAQGEHLTGVLSRVRYWNSVLPSAVLSALTAV